MKKLLCTALALILTCTASVSCGKDKNSGNNLVASPDGGNDVNETDMPYGSTVFQLTPESDDHIKYVTEFDKRYFGGDSETPDLGEIYLINDYIFSLNNNDHELTKNLFYPGYLEHIVQENSGQTIDEYLDQFHSSLQSVLGEDFEINFIDISNCYLEDDEAAESMIKDADKVLFDFDPSLASEVTSRKIVEVGGYTSYSSNGSSCILVDHFESITLHVYQIGGKYYIV